MPHEPISPDRHVALGGTEQGMTRPSMTRDDMALRAGEVSEQLRALANPNRLMIVCTLVEGEHSVARLEAQLGIRQPTLSQQLGALRAAGIVRTRRDAKHVVYRLSDAKAARLIQALYGIYCIGPAPQA